MSTSRSAEELRAAFDAGFAEPPPTVEAGGERVAAIVAGAVRLALPLRDIASLHRLPPITPVPRAQPLLAGIVAIDTRLVPVFGLAALAGLPDDLADCRWLALCRSGDIGLAFTRLEGLAQARLPQAGNGSANALGPTITVAGVDRTVIDITPIIDRIVTAATAAHGATGDHP